MNHIKVNVKLILLMFILLFNSKDKIINQDIPEAVSSKETTRALYQPEKRLFTEALLNI